MRDKPEASGIPIYCAFSEVKPAKDLNPNPKNPRKHPEQQLARYEAAIRGNGWRRPVVVSGRSGLIVKGHGAYETALRRGWDVPIEIQPYKSRAEETRDLLVDNRLFNRDRPLGSEFRGVGEMRYKLQVAKIDPNLAIRNGKG